jgi:ATP-dependent protease ClpP protease subunit
MKSRSVSRATDRDFILGGADAVAYGLVDEILEHRHAPGATGAVAVAVAS